MKQLTVLLILFLSGSVLFGQPEDQNKKTSFNEPALFFDIASYRDKDSGYCKSDIYVQVPFSKIHFVKSGDLFKAEYTVTVTVLNEKKSGTVIEKSWSEKIEIADFTQTVSKNNFNLSFKSFKLKPADYVFEVEVEDKDTRRVTKIDKMIRVRNMAGDFNISDALLISAKESATNRLVPNVSKIISNQTNQLGYVFDIYSNKKTKASVTVALNVQGDPKSTYTRVMQKDIDSGKNSMYITVDSVLLTVADYRTTITVLTEGSQTPLTITKDFVSRLPGLPYVIKDLDKAIDQMIYIATGTELDEIRKGKNYDEKLKFFREFWQKKDPSRATEENEIFNEYFRRVDYANKNFSHYVEGWKTDMGMVFIILGNPSNIDRHPFDYNSKPYEVWEYYELNRQFIFIDNTGFGDYRLVTPLSGDATRFRR